MAYDGAGTTIEFATSLFAANLIDLDGPELSRAVIDATHMGSSYGAAIPGKILLSGPVAITFEFNDGDDPPVDEDEETITITWNNTQVWEGLGFMHSYKPTARIGERITATAQLTFNGEVGITLPE